ncbi:AbrB/MazE/SpoVT family DNA-binding domain-containing protein [Candidatus Kaiserbacteria bacterium]|nr:AbrB/MazE/SpoVT family DNA-binding domain-containing protein [Candidatus Kaiserbacteria bacterium]
MKKKPDAKEFYGATTVGAKGQVVIPCDARDAMKLKEGDKLLVFGMGFDIVAFSKFSNLEKFASHLSTRLEGIQSTIKKNSKK